MGAVTSSRIVHVFRCCGTVLWEGTADAGVTLSSSLVPCPCSHCSWEGLQPRWVCHTACVHSKQQPVSFTIPGNEDCMAGLRFYLWSFCNKGISPLKEQCHKSCLCCFSRGSFWGAYLGVKKQLPGLQGHGCWDTEKSISAGTCCSCKAAHGSGINITTNDYRHTMPSVDGTWGKTQCVSNACYAVWHLIWVIWFAEIISQSQSQSSRNIATNITCSKLCRGTSLNSSGLPLETPAVGTWALGPEP